jgi:hypothetical protein
LEEIITGFTKSASKDNDGWDSWFL